MTVYTVIFYALGVFIVGTTALAVSRRNAVHAVLCLVASFFGTALLFYLLGAPFLAALEVIVYAGAIMVLFLFVVMTLTIEPSRRSVRHAVRQWFPSLVLAGICLVITVVVMLTVPTGGAHLEPRMASPVAFGTFLFEKYWLGVEIASFLLFVALAGALYLGRRDETPKEPFAEAKK